MRTDELRDLSTNSIPMNKEGLQNQPRPHGLTRREFLGFGLVVGGSLLTGCSEIIIDTPEATSNTFPPTSTLVPPTSTQTEIPPTATQVEPTPTETIEPTPTEELKDLKTQELLQNLHDARDASEKIFSMTDIDGHQIFVDVIPDDVEKEGSWSWELRGFTKEEEVNLKVWRTLKGRDDVEMSQWFDVVSDLEIPGYGTVTIEFDKEKMANRADGSDEKTLTEIYLQDAEMWKTALDIIWADKETSKIAEPTDYGLINDKIISRDPVPHEWFSVERLTKNAGTSFVLVPEIDDSFNPAERFEGKTWLAFKNTAQAGRPVLFLYFDYWSDGDRDLRSGNVGLAGIADLTYFVNQGGSNNVVEMIREDKNPWRTHPSGAPPTLIKNVWEALGIYKKPWGSPLVGP